MKNSRNMHTTRPTQMLTGVMPIGHSGVCATLNSIPTKKAPNGTTQEQDFDFISWLRGYYVLMNCPMRQQNVLAVFFVPSPAGISWEALQNYTLGIINWANLQPFIFWQLWPTKAKSQKRSGFAHWPTANCSQLQIGRVST